MKVEVKSWPADDVVRSREVASGSRTDGKEGKVHNGRYVGPETCSAYSTDVSLTPFTQECSKILDSPRRLDQQVALSTGRKDCETEYWALFPQLHSLHHWMRQALLPSHGRGKFYFENLLLCNFLNRNNFIIYTK